MEGAAFSLGKHAKNVINAGPETEEVVVAAQAMERNNCGGSTTPAIERRRRCEGQVLTNREVGAVKKAD